MQPTHKSVTRSIEKPFDCGTARMRLLAAYFVVLIHAAWRFSLAEVIWLSAARFSVPLFVIISGFYLLASPQPTRKLTVKTLRLLGLMIFWSAVYYLYARLTGTVSGGTAALTVYLLTQPVHLWYLYAAAALYLFTPVFFVFAEHAGRSLYRYALALCFFFGSVVTILLRSGSFPLLADIMDKTKIAALLGFPGLFLLGGYFRRFPTARRERILLCAAALFSVAATAAWTWHQSAPHQQIEPLLMSFFAPGAVLPAAAIFAVFQAAASRPAAHPHAAAVLAEAARCTFGVYLLHPLVLLILRNQLHTTFGLLPEALDLPLRSLLVFLLSFGCTVLLRRIPFVRRFVS